ncbi:hypothetical protein HID58_002066 [Brassica napus]|uniref:Peptidylprolyl isomerase n=1 Tax=Brassica napus TaxID=3708 RepID=A0ABQ8ELG0_BRANA|nr:hypothetical protein HID58_002066 [Brassica napus]
MKNNITMAMHWIVLGCSPGDSSCVIVEDEINATIVRPLPYGVKLHAIVECDMLMEFVKDFKGTAQILEKGYVTDIQDNRKDVVVEHSRQLCSSQSVELNQETLGKTGSQVKSSSSSLGPASLNPIPSSSSPPSALFLVIRQHGLI